MTEPRIGEPTYTTTASTLFGTRAPEIDEGGALPPLLDPDAEAVVDASDEPLVRVEHRRIRSLANYWHAGWATAIAQTWLRRSAFERLVSVADALPEAWGLAVFDAWRPLELQYELFVAAADHPGLMAEPSPDPATPPPHLTGGAVDLTLTFNGNPIAAGTGFDDTTTRAHTAHFESEPGPNRHIRRALFHTMAENGFVVFSEEWWHFEYGTRRWAAVKNETPFYGPAAPPGYSSGLNSKPTISRS